MSLSIKNLELINFRNFSSLNLNNLNRLVIFNGPNAVGKTSILEAISLLSVQKSFKTQSSSQLIKDECELSKIKLLASDSNRNIKLESIITSKTKLYKVNSKKKKKADLKGVLPSVSFTPDDLELIKGSNSYKRNSFDFLGSQLSRNYYTIKKDYEKVLKQKKELLKNTTINDNLLNSINDLIVICGCQLYRYRISLFNKLKILMIKFYKEISNTKEEFSAIYTANWLNEITPINNFKALNKEIIEDSLRNSLHMNKKKEGLYQKCLVGPQTDEISFYINNKNVKDFASQGQQRSVVLAFKLAQVQLIYDVLNTKPILLLDDVMSELDEFRREKLTEFIKDDIQCFITTTNLSYFTDDILNSSKIINLNNCDGVYYEE